MRRAWINLYSAALTADSRYAPVIAQMETHYWYMKGLEIPLAE